MFTMIFQMILLSKLRREQENAKSSVLSVEERRALQRRDRGW